MPKVDFELAKELYEAGFPQEPNRVALFYDGQGGTVVRFPQLPFPRVGAYRAPSLTALVDACGDQFVSLRREGAAWVANDVAAATAEEAVALLWLRINAG